MGLKLFKILYKGWRRKDAKGKQSMQKELVTIALAVYNPNQLWLKELLDSLNQQTYPNLELVVCDDASDRERFLDMIALIKKSITKFPFRILQNLENLGSNRTFLRLIAEAGGSYIAFCDQDDIWMENKINRLYSAIKTEMAVLSYCDMRVVDRYGRVIAESLKKKRNRLCYIEGEDLAQNYIFHNCTAGCSMLLKRECALMADSIPEGTYWDHWLCILASIQGKIAFVKEALVCYRIHGANQSGVLAGIKSWEEYYQERILGVYRRAEMLYQKGCHYSGQREVERMVYARKYGKIKEMWKYRALCRREVYFEIIFSRMPEGIFRGVVWLLRRI